MDLGRQWRGFEKRGKEDVRDIEMIEEGIDLGRVMK